MSPGPCNVKSFKETSWEAYQLMRSLFQGQMLFLLEAPLISLVLASRAMVLQINHKVGQVSRMVRISRMVSLVMVITSQMMELLHGMLGLNTTP